MGRRPREEAKRKTELLIGPIQITLEQACDANQNAEDLKRLRDGKLREVEPLVPKNARKHK